MVEPTSGKRGTERLLWDCATIARVIEHDEPPAAERLREQLGDELTLLLTGIDRSASDERRGHAA
jgi:hypothetical protein